MSSAPGAFARALAQAEPIGETQETTCRQAAPVRWMRVSCKIVGCRQCAGHPHAVRASSMTGRPGRERIAMNSFQMCRLGTSLGTRYGSAGPPGDYKSVGRPSETEGSSTVTTEGACYRFYVRPFILWAPPWSHWFYCSALWRIVPVNTRVRPSHVLLVALLMAAPAAAQVATPTSEKVDYDAIYKIKEEGLPALAGDGHRQLAHRRVRPAADRFAELQGGRGLGRQAADRMGRDQPAHRVVGHLRPRLGERAVLRHRRVGRAALDHHGRAQGLDARAWTARSRPRSSSRRWRPRPTWRSGRASWPARSSCPMPTREVKAHFEPEASRMTRRGPGEAVDLRAGRGAAPRATTWPRSVSR